MADSHDQTESIAEHLLQVPPPGSRSAPITPTSVCEDQELVRSIISGSPLLLPPSTDRADRELRRIVRHPDDYVTRISPQIVDPIRYGEALREAGEVILIDLLGFSAPR